MTEFQDDGTAAKVTRRRFMAAGAAVFAAAGVRSALGAGTASGKASATGRGAAAGAGRKRLDPELVAFISDLHVGLPLAKQKYKTMRDYPHQPAATAVTVREILSLPVLPANVINLGDISLAFAESEDYDIAAEMLRPLTEAGITVTHAMGNHDLRAEFLRCFPGQDKTTAVPGRLVSVVATPHVDFLVLDSLKEPKKRGDYGASSGRGLGDEQIAWLRETVAAAKRPLFICAHHPPQGLGVPVAVPHNPLVAGWIHGHTHAWSTHYLRGGLDDNARMLRTFGLPTAGFEMDVGWALMRTGPGGATAECRARDHYYPLPRPAASRPAEWDAHVNDWTRRTVSFAFPGGARPA